MTEILWLFVHSNVPNDPASNTLLSALAARLAPETVSGRATGAYTWTQITPAHRIWLLHVFPYQPLNLSQPYQAALPATFNVLQSARTVMYGPEDAGLRWPRYVNWILRQAIDHGSVDVAVVITDFAALTGPRMTAALTALDAQTVLVQAPFGYVISRRFRQVVRDLREDLDGAPSIAEVKERIVAAGLSWVAT